MVDGSNEYIDTRSTECIRERGNEDFLLIKKVSLTQNAVESSRVIGKCIRLCIFYLSPSLSHTHTCVTNFCLVERRLCVGVAKSL